MQARLSCGQLKVVPLAADARSEGVCRRWTGTEKFGDRNYLMVVNWMLLVAAGSVRRVRLSCNA